MTTQEYNAIFSANLRHYMSLSRKTQADLARYLNVSTATVNYWCRGTKSPRMDKVDRMCAFLGVRRSDLMGDNAVAAPAATSAPPLQEDERELLSQYRVLNDTGKAEAIKRVGELCEIEKYRKDTLTNAQTA